MMRKKKKVLLIEMSEIVSGGIIPIIESTGEFRVEAALSSIGKRDLSAGEYDLMIVNPVSDGLYNIERFSAAGNRIVLLAHESYPENLTGKFDGIISLYDSKVRIIKTLREVMEQEHPASESDELSIREKEILASVAKGMTNKEIAEAFSISVNTVMTHRRNISTKLGINSISGLTVYAVINKLIEL